MLGIFVNIDYICRKPITFMNHRLEQFLSAENVSQAQFADKIGVARASVSHILAGRNRPGFDFIENMARFYPSLNLEWLITGKGKMYKEASNSYQPTNTIKESKEELQDNLFPEETLSNEVPSNDREISPVRREPAAPKRSGTPLQSVNLPHNVAKVVIFFTDGTYQELK